MRTPFDPEKVKSFTGVNAENLLSVSQLTALIKNNLESRFSTVIIFGETSNVRTPSSGHVYFTLKDNNAQIAVVLFKSNISKMKWDIEDGVQVVVTGRVSVYEARGQYQIIAATVVPKGQGPLELAFRQLYEKLKKEGLFDQSRKKALPALPETIGIITSATGAAVVDIIRTIERRFPKVRLLLYPVRVQGEGAGAEIAAAIAAMNTREDVDVLIVGRGGGSLEDLWAFNEEVVARAIYMSRIPVISAVGHEIDVTISDLVADVRAKTPTEAGELVVPVYEQVVEFMESLKNKLITAFANHLRQHTTYLKGLYRILIAHNPLKTIRENQQRLDELQMRLTRAVRNSISLTRERLDGLSSKLKSLSPLAILERGYSVTMDYTTGAVIRSPQDVNAGDVIVSRLAKGRLSSVVQKDDRQNGEKD